MNGFDSEKFWREKLLAREARKLRKRVHELEKENARLHEANSRLCEALREVRDVLALMDVDGSRQRIKAPEDSEVRDLCERTGYGAVMDSAARQWRKMLARQGFDDGGGAFLVGPCVTHGQVALRTIDAALAALKGER